jgi:hypothetical protein
MPPPGAVLVLPSADALELALGAGVVVAEAMPATPIPVLRASAVAVRPRVIFFVRDISCLLDPPSVTAGDGFASSGAFTSIRAQLLEKLFGTFHLPVNAVIQTCPPCKIARSVRA